MAIALTVKTSGVKELTASLLKRKKALDENLEPTSDRCATLLLQMVLGNFVKARSASTDNPPNGWEPMRPFTRFVRGHKQGKTDKNPKLLNDTGLLANSNFKFVRNGGSEFGVANNLRYASVQNFGGVSQANTVQIRGVERTSKLGKKYKVRDYTMNIKGGHRIPARPFFPTEDQYGRKVLSLIRIYVKSGLS